MGKIFHKIFTQVVPQKILTISNATTFLYCIFSYCVCTKMHTFGYRYNTVNQIPTRFLYIPHWISNISQLSFKGISHWKSICCSPAFKTKTGIYKPFYIDDLIIGHTSLYHAYVNLTKNDFIWTYHYSFIIYLIYNDVMQTFLFARKISFST